MSGLWKICANVKSQQLRKHSDPERCVEGVWTAPEEYGLLDLALDVGYTAIENSEVL